MAVWPKMEPAVSSNQGKIRLKTFSCVIECKSNNSHCITDNFTRTCYINEGKLATRSRDIDDLPVFRSSMVLLPLFF